MSLRAALWLTVVVAHVAWAEATVEAGDDAGVAPDAAAPSTPAVDEPPASEPSPQPARSAHHAFRVWVGGGFFGRQLQLNETPVPWGITQPGAGAIDFGLSVFPGAAVTRNALAHLGAFAAGSFTTGMLAATPDARFGTTGSRLHVGLQGRIPVNDDLSIVLRAGYSRARQDTAEVSLDGSRRRVGTPNLLLDGVRGGVVVQWRVWERLTAELGAAAQYLVHLGELQTEYFPRATGAGLDTSVAVTVELVTHLAARLSFDWQRAFFSLRPQPGATYTAPNGFDNMVWLNLGLQWSM